MNHEAINRSMEETAEVIRQEVASQVDIWRRLPYLAILAEGNNGFSDRRFHMYDKGLAHVAIKGCNEFYLTFIDCENGEIVGAHRNEVVPATAKRVLHLAASHGGVPDAAEWLKELEADLDKKTGSDYRTTQSAARLRQWKEAVIQAKGLSAEFDRRAFKPDVITPAIEDYREKLYPSDDTLSISPLLSMPGY